MEIEQLDLIDLPEKPQTDLVLRMDQITALWECGLLSNTNYAAIAVLNEIYLAEDNKLDLNSGAFFKLTYKYQGNMENKDGSYKSLPESAFVDAAYRLADKEVVEFAKQVQCKLALGDYGHMIS